MKYTLIIAVLSTFVAGCSYINSKIGQEDDWFGEQFLEEVIEQKTGIKIDLTP